MRKFLRELHLKHEFNPPFWEIFLSEGYFVRKELFENIKYFAVNFNGKILDVGCGSKPYEKLFSVDEYIGLEYNSSKNIENKNVDYFNKADYLYSGGAFPFEDNFFNGVISTQVLEHVPDPRLFLIEINRVLKKDGLILISFPLMFYEHEKPYDFFRFTSFGIQKLLKETGFEIIEKKKLATSAKTLVHLSACYIAKNIKNIYLKYFLISIINMTGLILFKILPKDTDYYSDMIILAKK